MRAVALDTSGPMATNWGDVVFAEAGKEGAAKGPTTSCQVLHDDDKLWSLSGGGASQVGLPHW